MTADAWEAVEQRTQEWIRDRFLEGRERAIEGDQAVFDAHGEPRRLTRYHFQTLQRKLKIFRWLDRLDFQSFIDVGSGFDHYPYLVHERYGVPANYSDFTHHMNLPLDDYPSGKLDHAVTMNIVRLPFPDGAFDVVLSSEVLEHLVRPVEAVAELLRITRKALIMTSLEALSPDRNQRFWAHHRVDVRIPHVERNFLLLDEFCALFGDDLHHENLFYAPHLPANPFAPEAQQDAAYAALADRTSLEQALCYAVAIDAHQPGAMGILLVKTMPECTPRPAPPDGDRVLASWLIAQTVAVDRQWNAAIARRSTPGRVELPPRDRPVAPALLELIRCPDCRGRLEPSGEGLRCGACGASFATECGVPVLYPRQRPESYGFDQESLRRFCGNDPRRVRLVRRLCGRLRRNERPPSRFRRALWKLEDRLNLGPPR